MMISISISRIIKIKVQHPPQTSSHIPKMCYLSVELVKNMLLIQQKMIIIVSLITHNDHKYVINLSSL